MDDQPKYIDGKFSIEHQIDIHVRDLVESPDQLSAVLEGLRYLVDYRLSNRRYHHMDIDLMHRLALGLLECTGERQGAMFARRRLATPLADQALQLFRDFLREVDEFAQTVGAMPLSELRTSLQLHRRLYQEAGPESHALAKDIIQLLSKQVDDWRDLVKPERVDEVMMVFEGREEQEQGVGDETKISPHTKHLHPPQALYFDRTIPRILDMFRTNIDTGLAEAEYKDNLHHYGPNIIPKPPVKQWWAVLLSQFNDFMIYLFLVAIILSPIIEPEDRVSPVVLSLVVIMNASIGFVQEMRAAKTLSSLMTLQIPKARVRRGAKEEQVNAESLVPGDIVVLAEGDSVPADLRLIKVFRLEIVESLLTGESVPVVKQTSVIKTRSRRLPLQLCSNAAFLGTVVARGSGVGVVVRTGVKSEMGVVSEALYSQAQNTKSPLQLELRRLGVWLVAIAVASCLLIVAIGFLVNRSPFKQMLHYGLNLAVSVIPEGLVAVVTVAMALAVARMAKRNAIIRQLPAVETLGSVNIICTDKTGTLTEGRMRVQAVLGDLSSCYSVCCLCNNASIVKTVSMTEGTKVAVQGADSTEVALLEAALTNGFDKNELMMNISKLIEIPFDSERKMMSTVIWDNLGGCKVMSKGAPEVILSKCVDYMESGGVVGSLTDDKLSELARVQADWSDRGWRVLGLARTDLTSGMQEDVCSVFSEPSDDPNVFDKAAEAVEQDLCFVGLIALVDPPRQGIAECVSACHRAGIEVIMITGDHQATASAIAKQIGLFNHDQTYGVMKGLEVDILGEDGLKALAKFPRVFARVSPQNKLAIVKALQSRKQITAMTGDGVNDAPAIRKADIGIAMGLSGTDIAKQAADMVLADDNFSTIIGAVEEGRRLYDNITKFIVYLLACNSAEIWIVLVALMLQLPVPLASVHLLWANIIADIPPSMSLGLEPGEADLLTRSPRSKSEQLLSPWNVVYIILQGLVIALLSLSRYVYGMRANESDVIGLKSETFVCLTIMQLHLSFLSRSLTHSFFSMNFFGNPWMILAFFLSTMTLLLGSYVPGLNNLLEMTPINAAAWLRIAGCCVLLTVFTEVLKYIRRRHHHGHVSSGNNNNDNNDNNYNN